MPGSFHGHGAYFSLRETTCLHTCSCVKFTQTVLQVIFCLNCAPSVLQLVPSCICPKCAPSVPQVTFCPNCAPTVPQVCPKCAPGNTILCPKCAPTVPQLCPKCAQPDYQIANLNHKMRCYEYIAWIVKFHYSDLPSSRCDRSSRR